MPAYWVARSRIEDPVEYKKYTDLVPAIVEKWGGKVLSRGADFKIMEGPDTFQRFVVIEFPTFEDGVGCFESQEYQDAAQYRRNNGAGRVETVILQAGEFTKYREGGSDENDSGPDRVAGRRGGHAARRGRAFRARTRRGAA